MLMEGCPKYLKCSAPLCPLDLLISKRKYLKGESICFYMNEFVKPNSRERFNRYHTEEIYEAIAEVLPEVLSRYGYLQNRLNRASKTPSRMDRIISNKNIGVTI